MSARDYLQTDRRPLAGIFATPRTGSASRLGIIIGLVVAVLLILRVTVAEWHVMLDKQEDRKLSRQKAIAWWMTQNLREGDAKVLSYGEIQRGPLNDSTSLEVMMHEANKPVEQRYSIWRFTFDSSDKITGAVRRVVP